MLRDFLFPAYHSFGLSMVLLLARVAFGGIFLTHGLQKLMKFSTLKSTFPSIMGLGSTATLCLAIFAEVLCTLGFITGFLYRLSLIPMIFTMFVAAFAVHDNNPFSAKELALLYMLIFILLYILGPGSFAADWFFAREW